MSLSISTMDGDAPLVVSEIFGPTFQGEGPSVGQRAGFVRLGRCNLTCQWCVGGDTPVLMADGSVRAITDVYIGDEVLSYRHRQFETARVLAAMSRDVEETVTVRAGDAVVRTTPDHVFVNPHHLDARRRSPAAELEGRHVRASRISGWEPDAAVRNASWWRGWAQGVVAGDGHVGRSAASPYDKVWLRVTDRQLADAFCGLARSYGARCNVREGRRRTSAGNVVWSVVFALSRLPWLVNLPTGMDEVRGWLGGFFDAEGHISTGRRQAVLTQFEPKTLDRVCAMLDGLGIWWTRSDITVTINGTGNVDRFMNLCRPVSDRKRLAHRSVNNRMLQAIPVAEVKPAGPCTVHNLTTTSGFFFADGLLVEQCDTPFTWNWASYNPDLELSTWTTADVLRQLDNMDVDLVVITGGEPLLQQRHLGPLLEGCRERGWRVEVETNGTVPPNVAVTQWNVSPKLTNSGVVFERRYRPEVLRAFEATGRAVFKFVVAGPADLDEVDRIVEECGLRQVWIMPEGTDAATVTARLADLAAPVLARGWQLTPRLHILIWGDRRGV